MPREKKATIVKISLLRPVLASIELARKASMARRQGLKPAKRPAAKTVAADERVRPLRAFSEAHAGEVITVICELSLAKAGKKIMTNATVSRIAGMQNRMASILIFLDGCIIVTEVISLKEVGLLIIYYYLRFKSFIDTEKMRSQKGGCHHGDQAGQ